MMKVLNLYAGIGGNRKLWEDVEVTAVEYNPEIAEVYKRYFPEDEVIVGDAHQYLLDNYQDFDFIWASPPCPTHSRFNNLNIKSRTYPDMRLWQEIIFIRQWFKGKYCIENVITYYDPLIVPQECDNHYYWCNFKIPFKPKTKRGIRRQEHDFVIDKIGFDVSLMQDKNKAFIKQVYNNAVQPQIGLMILDIARGIIRKENVEQLELFEQ